MVMLAPLRSIVPLRMLASFPNFGFEMTRLYSKLERRLL